MQKTALLFLLLTGFFTPRLFAQPDSKALSFSAQYVSLKRTGLDNYLLAVSDTMGLNGNLEASPESGVGVQFLARKEKGEFEGGITYTVQRVIRSSDTGSYQVRSKVYDAGFRLGGNYFPVKLFFIGGQLVINSFSGDLKTYHDLPASVASVLQPPPSTDLNIFRGISFVAHAQAGFNIPFSKDRYSGMRLLAYYNVGSKYKYFDASETRFAGYTGDKKTASNGYGFSLAFYFPIGDD